MAEQPSKMSEKKIFIGVGILFLFLAIAYALSLGPLPEQEEAGNSAEPEAAVENIETEEQAQTVEDLLFDLELAKKERILGDSVFPIKITEHSSFSCGHCAKFHKETFAKFKEAYIDTGKAYLVFSDFPLNAPALHASMAARCVAEDRYFDFVHMLFETQEDWAYESDYMNALKDKAQKYGLEPKAFHQCVQNKELQEAILNRMKAVGAQYKVSSTPSFVVNNRVTINGALSFEQFDEAIRNAIKEIAEENTDTIPDDADTLADEPEAPPIPDEGE